MKKIAALLTCHNRKAKTLRSLEHLYIAQNHFSKPLIIDVYLTDDGSTDGTVSAVKNNYPKVNILSGDGTLFWAKGMNMSWEAALNKDYDGYLLINDDTFVYSDLFSQLELTESECLNKFNNEGVYIGTTRDINTQEFTYGGSVITNRFLYRYKRLKPNGRIQPCHLGNANIMYVSNSAVLKVGILSKGYAHGVADYDFTLKCTNKNIPVLIMPNYNGNCEYDHKNLYHNFENKSLKERIQYLNSPLGIDFKSRLLYMKKFFPLRFPFFYLIGWLKVLFPRFYKYTFSKR